MGFLELWDGLESPPGGDGLTLCEIPRRHCDDVGSKRLCWSDRETADQGCGSVGCGAKIRKTRVIGSNRSEPELEDGGADTNSQSEPEDGPGRGGVRQTDWE